MNNGVNNINTNTTNNIPVNGSGIVTNQVQANSSVNGVSTTNNVNGVPLENQSPTQVLVQNSPDVNNQNTPNDGNLESVKPKLKMNFSLILLLVIIGLFIYIFYINNSYKKTIETLNYNCTPVSARGDDVKLDLNSTLVKDLYSRVVTNIREDLAESEFNDSMKLYLAYRQLSDNDKYDSNCNMFNSQTMEPYKCEESLQFVPKAFKEDVLKVKFKTLFGDATQINLGNIQLGSSCIGGYQYIPERGEFVQGYCSQPTATSFKVTKKLTEAISNRNRITLVEEVKYHENEKMTLPDNLKSGIYRYTFKLDMNYNYVLVAKTFEDKY